MTLNLNRMSSYWNRDERIKINDNWDKIEESYNGVVDEVTQKAYNEIIDTVRDLTKINWLEPVPTYDDIAATYPNPTLGDITITTDDGSVYRYDGEQWVYINKIDPDVYMQLQDDVAAIQNGLEETNNNLMQLQQDFMSHLAENNKQIAPIFNVKGYGAKGDGVTDDWQAITDAINAIPNNSAWGGDAGKQGGILYFPKGHYLVSKPILIDKLGVKVVGVSIETTVISPTNEFIGDSLIEMKQTNSGYSNVGVGMSSIGIYMNNINAHGISVYKAYDGVTFEDINVRDVADAYSAFRFIPDSDNPEKVSQTLNLFNLTAIHKNKTATAPLFVFEYCQEINLFGCKAFGTWESNLQPDYSDAPNCIGFDFVNSQGITMIGCSAAFVGGHAIRVYARDKTTNGFAMMGCTFESVGGIFKGQGSVNGAVDHVRVVSYRKEGSINIGSQGLKGFDLIKVRNSMLETKDATVSLNSECQQNMIISQVPTNVTDLGNHTTLIGQANAINSNITLNPGIKTPKAEINGFYAEGAEQMSLVHPWASGQTGILLNVNKDGTISKVRVELGDIDSGGAGYRVLRIPN